MNMKAFYVVWRRGGDYPMKVHESIEGAQAEARRLAATNPREHFVVMKAVSGHEYRPEPEVRQFNYGGNP